MAKTGHYRQNESIFEIRFKPNPKLIDHRGKWAEAIANHLGFKHWRIDQNRIDVNDDTDETHLFLTYKNCGMTLHDVRSIEFFANYSKRFLSFVFEMDNFGDSIQIERLGVRTLFCTPFSGNYQSLLKKYSERYLKVPEKALEIIGNNAVLTDIGGYLNFKDDAGNFNTACGPMPKKQFLNYFSIKTGNFPDVGLFYDIDYWVTPKKILSADEIIIKIEELYASGWNRHTRISNFITKG